MERKIDLRELESYRKATEKQKSYLTKNPVYDLGLITSDGLRDELEAFIRFRAAKVSLVTMQSGIINFRQICRFLDKKGKNINSFLERDEEKWIRMLKGWLLEEGLSITGVENRPYGKQVVKAGTIEYMGQLLKFLQPEDTRDEREKDIWQLEKLNINIRYNPIKAHKTINFTRILQPGIRDELKKAIYMQLSSEAIACIIKEMTAMRRLSAYLKEKYPEVDSCSEIDRPMFEEYLLYLKTEDTGVEHYRAELTRLRSVLEVIGKIYGYQQLIDLFLTRDIPPTLKAEFKTYSDAELKRLNAYIVKMDEQIARVMIIHQMLGTRISDTLTLEMDCLYKKDDITIIKIRQMKTHMFEKPISEELAMLIRLAMEYTRKKHGDTRYVFVDEKLPERPLQYNTVQRKVITMIYKEDIRDDNGNLFGFGTHMYRHYYGAKLTELHLDDWTIAKMLGQRSVRSVQYYRKMSNQLLADETRLIRQKISEMILENLDGWGEEYEQIRQDDCCQ